MSFDPVSYAMGQKNAGEGIVPSGTKRVNITQNGTRTENVRTYANVEITVNTEAPEVEEKQVNFIDYDGTILYSYTASEASALTNLPANPTHDGLTSQGWNWSLEEIKAQLTAMPKASLWVGQMYITSDGKTRLYCEFEEYRHSPILGIGVNGSVIIDWGDGGQTDALTGTSLSTLKTIRHDYSNAGKYVISIEVVNGSFAIYGSGSMTYLLGRDLTDSVFSMRTVYTSALKKVEIGENVSIDDYAFYCCKNLSSITLPRSIINIGHRAFGSLDSLKWIVLPVNSVVSESNATDSSFYNSTIEGISVPAGTNFTNRQTFFSCAQLKRMTIPSRVTSIGQQFLNGASCMTHLIIPSGVTSIGAKAFNVCYGIKEYHFLSETPPSLENVNAFNGITDDCVIYVPYSADHSILTYYTRATNWATYADHMQEEPLPQ